MVAERREILQEMNNSTSPVSSHLKKEFKTHFDSKTVPFTFYKCNRQFLLTEQISLPHLIEICSRSPIEC